MVTVAEAQNTPTPGVKVPGQDAPVRQISGNELRQLGQMLSSQFGQYKADRRLLELRWLRNLRQYLGMYDPEVERALLPTQSRAYPKITRVKCISMLSRIMDLMFPSDDVNWTLKARPSPDMKIADVKKAVVDALKADSDAQGNAPQPADPDAYIQAAVSRMATKRAEDLSREITDQLQELGGDQSYDYVKLNKEVVTSGIMFGAGFLAGPFARERRVSTWAFDPATKQPKAKTVTRYIPQFDFERCWDVYPDMSAKRLEDGDGYYLRKILSKQQLRELADREDFFGKQIKKYLSSSERGNYTPQTFETELRSLGVKAIVNENKAYTTKYEVVIWRGPVDGKYLRLAGCDVSDDKLADMLQAEVWLLDGIVIKASMNPWFEAGYPVKLLHSFVFDQDDTSPIGMGLPNVMRDTQMSVCAATRMILDNSSVVSGPMLEVNLSLMMSDQDLRDIYPRKIWYRNDEGPSSQYPAVRPIEVDANIDELQKVVEMFMRFGDLETFVGAATGGDMEKLPSEPMRNAAGASMLLGNAALPFKDIIRNFDGLTMSVIQSLVVFNRILNPDVAPAADYDVIARGATSLIAKEVRGIQLDQLSQSLTPEQALHVDIRKLVAQRLKVRDLNDLLVPEDEARRRQAAQDAQQAQSADMQQQLQQAQIRKLLSDALKNIAQGNKNQANADIAKIGSVLDILERSNKNALTSAQIMGAHASTAATLAGMAGGDDGGQGQAGGAGAGAGADPAGGSGVPQAAPGVAGDPGASIDGGADPNAGPGGLPQLPGPGAGLSGLAA